MSAPRCALAFALAAPGAPFSPRPWYVAPGRAPTSAELLGALVRALGWRDAVDREARHAAASRVWRDRARLVRGTCDRGAAWPLDACADPEARWRGTYLAPFQCCAAEVAP